MDNVHTVMYKAVLVTMITMIQTFNIAFLLPLGFTIDPSMSRASSFACSDTLLLSASVIRREELTWFFRVTGTLWLAEGTFIFFNLALRIGNNVERIVRKRVLRIDAF